MDEPKNWAGSHIIIIIYLLGWVGLDENVNRARTDPRWTKLGPIELTVMFSTANSMTSNRGCMWIFVNLRIFLWLECHFQNFVCSKVSLYLCYFHNQFDDDTLNTVMYGPYKFQDSAHTGYSIPHLLNQ